MDERYIDRYWTSPDGLQLHYRDYAASEGSEALPVICLHGLTRNARDFAKLAEHIAPARRVIVPEMRGRGLSDYAKDSSTYALPTYVADMQALLADQGIEKFVAIGTSMGGLITMLTSLVRPGVIAGAVINDIGPEVDPTGIERIAGYVGQGRSYPTWMHAARALQEAHSASAPDFTIHHWLAMAKRAMVLSQNGRISYDYDMAIAEPFREAGNTPAADLWPAFESLGGVPLLLVRGEISDLLSVKTAQEMGERHPDLTLVTIPRTGHAPSLEEPASMEAIDALLARVP